MLIAIALPVFQILQRKKDLLQVSSVAFPVFLFSKFLSFYQRAIRTPQIAQTVGSFAKFATFWLNCRRCSSGMSSAVSSLRVTRH
jgi:hypothetical protein